MKYLLSFTFLLIAIIAFGQLDSIKQKEELDCELMLIVEQMPMFPACDSLTDYTERKSCADKAMLEFVYSNLKWPKNAGCVEGTAVVSFIIKKDGSISDAKVIRDPGAGCGDEALRVVNLMPKWIPGRQRNQAVNVQINLPIRFRLE